MLMGPNDVRNVTDVQKLYLSAVFGPGETMNFWKRGSVFLAEITRILFIIA
jgi:hypothetical protein